MPRDFDGTSGYLEATTTLGLSAFPFSYACWFQTDVVNADQCLMSLSDLDSTPIHYMGFRNTGDAFRVHSTGGSQNGLTGLTAGTWYHGAGVWASATSRTPYTNGTAYTTDTGSKVYGSTPDTFTIGAQILSSTRGQYFNGRIAWAAVWNVALAQNEVSMLYAGCYPPMLPRRPIAFWPLFGDSSTEQDIIGRYDLTLSGTAPKISSGPTTLLRPSGPRILKPPTAAPAGGTPFYYQRRRRVA